MIRPPKKWFYKAVSEFSKDRNVSDPSALAAWMWYYGMNDETRKEVINNNKGFSMAGLPKKYAKYGFKTGWKMYRNAHKKRKTTSPKNIIKGETVAGKKRSRKRRSRRMSGENVNFMGARRKRRSRRMGGQEQVYYGRRKRRGRRMGGELMGAKGLSVKGATAAASGAALALAGGIGGRIVKNVIPVADLRIKAAIPVAIGLLLSMMAKKSKAMSMLGLGMAAFGGSELLAVMFPNVALLQGEGAAAVEYSQADIADALKQNLISQDEANKLAQAAGFMGVLEDFSGEEEEAGQYQPGIDPAELYGVDSEWQTTQDIL